MALLVYLIAQIGYYSSTVFYDSLLIDVAEPRIRHYARRKGRIGLMFARRGNHSCSL